MEDGDGPACVDPGLELEHEELVDEIVDTEMEDTDLEEVVPDGWDHETRHLAAGLASQDEGEVLAALEATQKAVIGPDGEKVVVAYVLASSHCTEIMRVWRAGPGAPAAVPVMLLLYYMFRHPLGKFGGNASVDHQNGLSADDRESHRKVVAVKLRLDKLARTIVRTEMRDVYSHLSSSQKSRQNAALLLLSSIVLRGRALAIEIATSFDFTLEALRKLGHPPKQGARTPLRVEGHRVILKQPTRAAFVELAVSFLSVGDPGVLRWILQKRPLWMGVLHGISKDDERTIVRVLTLLQNKVMAPAFLVPRGLQSVLFGDATLEQLTRISADSSLVDAGELAHTTLLALCTDPSHGLCPDNPEVSEAAPSRSKCGAFGGGQGRLLRLMLRLKVTEVTRHRDVLLATARTRPRLAALYLASIPLSLEPRVSAAWFNAMSLVSELIPIASQPPSFSSLAAQRLVPTTDGPLLQSLLLSLLPGSLSRVVLNRGLLHVDFMVKHACLRVLFEALSCLRGVIDAVDAAGLIEPAQGALERTFFSNTYDQSDSINGLMNTLKPQVEEFSLKEEWMRLSQSIQDVMRASLPDPNTLLAILSSLKVTQNLSVNDIPPSSKAHTQKKRKREVPRNENGTYELKNPICDKYDYDTTIVQLWGPEVLDKAGQGEETEGLLHAKVLQVLAAYQMALPSVMADNGFDAFKLLPDDPTSLSVVQQKSLSALLLATTGSTTSLLSKKSQWLVEGFAGSGSVYKKFKQLLMFMLNSKVKEVRDAVYLTVYRVMVGTGAFDRNPREISFWIDLLVPWKIEKSDMPHIFEGSINLVRTHNLLPGTLRASLVDFLSEAVSSIGQNLYKYLDSLHSILAKYTLHEDTDNCDLQKNFIQGVNVPEFGPFVVCALANCIQSMTCKSKVSAEHSAVVLYVANVLELLLQFQASPELLAVVVVTLLSRERELPPEQAKCAEWTVLLGLFQHAQLLVSSQGNSNFRGLKMTTVVPLDQGYQARKLAEVLKVCQEDQKATVQAKLSVLTSSLVWVSVQELVDNFPSLMRFCLEDLEGDFSVLIPLLGIHQNVLYEVSIAWPEMFLGGMELAASVRNASEDRWTGGEAKTLTIKLESSGVMLEAAGFCILLLVAPFSVLFSAAVYCKRGLLLASQTFSSLLQASLQRVDYQNWICMMRLIISGLKRIAALSLEEIDIGLPLQTCFSLIRSLVLPTQQSLGGKDSVCSSIIMPVYEDMIIDLLNHPKFYHSFLHPGWTLGTSVGPCPDVSDLRRDIKDKKTFDTSLRRVLASAATNVHPLDCHILSLVTRLLESSQTLVDCGNSFLGAHHSSGFRMKLLNACKPYILKATGTLQIEVDESSQHGVQASPALFAVSVLIPYTEPLLLLKIFLSLLSTKALKVKSSKQAVAPHVLGLHFVTVFVDSVPSAALSFAKQGDQPQTWAWDEEPEIHVHISSIYDLYEKVIDQVIGSPSIMADLCLLSFLQAPNLKRSHLPYSDQLFERFNKTSSALAHSTPLEVLRHCVCHPNKVTGKIAMLLAEMSPVHLIELGRLLALGTANRSPHILNSSPSVKFAETLLTHHPGVQKMELVLSDEDLLSLLPAAHIYVVSESRKAADVNGNELANRIASVYAKLITKQLKDWDKFVSIEFALDEVQDESFQISTLQQDHSLYVMLMKCYNRSSLGQAINMLQFCHKLHPLNMKVQTSLLQRLLPEDQDPLLTQNILLAAGDDVNHCVFEALAKADIVKHLLVSSRKLQAKGNGSVLDTEGQGMGQQTQTDDATSKDSAALEKFLSSLVSTLDMLYKNNALHGNKIDTTVSEAQIDTVYAQWLQLLEETFLVHIADIAKKLAQSSLDISKYLTLYRYSMTTLLGYRYGGKSAMKASRYLTFVIFQRLQCQTLAEYNSPDPDILELFIAHSKFLPTLLVADSKKMHIPHISGKHAGKGTALNSLSSVLSLVGSPLVNISRGSKVRANDDRAFKLKSRLKETVAPDVKEGNDGTMARRKHGQANGALDDLNRLELVKLLRVLLGVRLKQLTLCTVGVQPVPLKEVLSILLAAYGGTMSDVDLEIFLLMQEIESHGGLGFSGLSGMDYLWGEAALKRREKSGAVKLNDLEEPDSPEELRRQTFKEYLLIDPRRCGLAVLYFPSKRQFGGADIGQLGLAKQYIDSSESLGGWECSSGAIDGVVKTAAYDPAFLLLFALHGLSTGCINAEEFVHMGLLAIAFASMSSAEESMRKAGYETLSKYYSVLEDGPSFKGRLQIRLLMTYVKNAVTEPWQRIPAVFAVFAAEASCILMHPENHQYMIINRFLLRAPSLDLECIPLFQVMFGSGSVQYRSDRLWMLRLLAAGLQSSLDAHVYRRKFVLELLMSFHDTTMADSFPRKWILQVLYQAATVRSCARYLVERTGLLSWLASAAVNDVEGDIGLQDDGGSGQIAAMALQVIERVMSWGSVQQHFFLDCLEELSKVGHMFHQLLVQNSTTRYQNMFRRSTINIMLTLVRLSHKRRKHQTHFTLNLEGLMEVLHWVGIEVPQAIEFPDSHMEDRKLVLQLLLQTSPPSLYSREDKLSLLKVARWAIPVALQLEMGNANWSYSSAVNSHCHLTSGPQVQESFSEKLLRWFVASVVRGELAKTEGKMESREEFVTCFSVVYCFATTTSRGKDSRSGINEKLASLLLTLEGHVSEKAEGTSLVPVVAALVILTRFTTTSLHPGDCTVHVAQEKIQCILTLLLSELPCPVEANSSWLWSFNSPWAVQDDCVRSLDDSAVEAGYFSEICRTLIILLQQLLSRKPTHYSSLLSRWEPHLAQKHPTDSIYENDPIKKAVRIKLSALQVKVSNALLRKPACLEEELL